MRQIALDTETTGLSPKNGDRVVEIGCVELINHMPTGRTYQTYLNPQKMMDPSAEKNFPVSVFPMPIEPVNPIITT